MNRSSLLLSSCVCLGGLTLLGCSSKPAATVPPGMMDATTPDAAVPEAGADDATTSADAAIDAGAWRTSLLDTDIPRALPADGGVAPTPPMGWNSWNHWFCNVSETVIEQAADQIVATGMQDAGYQYVNIDDCWQLADRDDAGAVQPDPTRFPGGIKPVADYVHGKGLKLGIYSDRGTATCQGRAGSQGYETQDALSYASWGVDYLKYDNCNVTLDMETQYKTMRAALDATQRPFVFSLCSWEFDEWDLGTGHLWRTTGDIAPVWLPTPNVMGSVSANLRSNGLLAAYAGPNGWNDPDMLEVGQGMTFPEDKSHFTMWALMAAPLIAGNDVTNMTSGTKTILTNTEVIALDQDALGIQGAPVRIDGDLTTVDSEVWAKPLNEEGARAVVFLNAGPNTADISATFAEVGLSPGNATVRDLWLHQNLGMFTDSYTATAIPSHSVVALEVVGTEPPIPIGTAWASDVTWTYASNGLGPVEKDMSNGGSKAHDGKPLTLQGKTYAKGLGVSGPSAIVYRLGKVCTAFTADVGVDAETMGKGSVVFHVLVDDVEKFNSGTVAGTTPAQSVNVDLTGASRLRLLVTNAGDGSANDRADWARAQIVCP